MFDDLEPLDEQELNMSHDSTLPHISGSEMVKMLKDPGMKTIIIDCRFRYEYDGGHIAGAINFDNVYQLMRVVKRFKGIDCNIVFHCEFSMNRGPTIASLFRQKDREMNRHCYPKIDYQNVYILNGGYSRFYREYSDMCVGEYTPMRGKGVNGNMLQRCEKKMKTEIELFKRYNPLTDKRYGHSQNELSKSQPLLLLESIFEPFAIECK